MYSSCLHGSKGKGHRSQYQSLPYQADHLNKIMEFEQGKPIAFPEGIEEKYTQQGLVKNINQAFADAGLPIRKGC